jgi:GcrA cell cycle regulator
MTDLPAAPDIVLPTPDKRVTWTQRRLDRAVAMWKAGQSGLEIAVELGITRCAVIGKLIRVGLRRGSGEGAIKAYSGKPATLRRAPKQENRAPWVPSPQPKPKPETVGMPIALIDLQSHHCRWPVDGRGAATLFCGGNAHDGHPYCIGHCRRAYQRWGAA